MRNLLIISPKFPPINAPDMQRVRMSLPYYEEFGWKPYVFAFHPDEFSDSRDNMLSATIPAKQKIKWVRGIPAKYTRWCGLRSPGIRCYHALNRAVEKILSRQRFDCLFFSTTMFNLMTLGPKWKEKFSVPYVLDFQDPWVNDYYLETRTKPPGGWIKYRIVQTLARFQEPLAIRESSACLCVSDSYPASFTKRYPDVPEDLFTVLPFAASEADFDIVRQQNIHQRFFLQAGGISNWVSIGNATDPLQPVINQFLKALATLRQNKPSVVSQLRIFFIGTTNNSSDTPLLGGLIRQYRLQDMVFEKPARIPFLTALRTMMDADRLLIFGSPDAGYTASKIYPALLSETPPLAFFHEKSPAVRTFEQVGAPEPETFQTEALSSFYKQIEQRIAYELNGATHEPVSRAVSKKFTAREMTRRQCEVFNRVAES